MFLDVSVKQFETRRQIAGEQRADKEKPGARRGRKDTVRNPSKKNYFTVGDCIANLLSITSTLADN